MNPLHQKTLIELIRKYGRRNQIDMAIEEMSELTKALCKDKRGMMNKEEIIDEIADVEIMISQLKIIHGCHNEVEQRIDYKINRQKERMRL